MPLPPIAFYSIYEISVRWGCHPAVVARFPLGTPSVVNRRAIALIDWPAVFVAMSRACPQIAIAAPVLPASAEQVTCYA